MIQEVHQEDIIPLINLEEPNNQDYLEVELVTVNLIFLEVELVMGNIAILETTRPLEHQEPQEQPVSFKVPQVEAEMQHILAYPDLELELELELDHHIPDMDLTSQPLPPLTEETPPARQPMEEAPLDRPLMVEVPRQVEVAQPNTDHHHPSHIPDTNHNNDLR